LESVFCNTSGYVGKDYVAPVLDWGVVDLYWPACVFVEAYRAALDGLAEHAALLFRLNVLEFLHELEELAARCFREVS
jgi:hypothetical protein